MRFYRPVSSWCGPSDGWRLERYFSLDRSLCLLLNSPRCLPRRAPRFLLHRRASFFFSGGSCLFGLRLLLCRGTSVLLGAAARLFGMTLRIPLRRSVSFFLCEALCLFGLAALHLSLLSACVSFGSPTRFLDPALGLSLSCGAGLVIGASPRAHHDRHDRGCERETNSGDDEKHLHER
jgi:hypothetical protein